MTSQHREEDKDFLDRILRSNPNIQHYTFFHDCERCNDSPIGEPTTRYWLVFDNGDSHICLYCFIELLKERGKHL